MLKKLLTAGTVTVMLAAMLTGGVFAAEYLNQDFENGIDVFMANTPPDGAARRQVSEGENTVVFFDNPTADALQNRINSSVEALTSGGVMMFDYKNGEKIDSGYVYVEFHQGTVGSRVSKCVYNISAAAHEVDTWYTYVITMNKDCNESRVYRKKRDTDEPFSYLADATTPTNGENSAMWRMYSVKHGCYFDNIRIFSGIFTKNLKFSVDGNEISSIDDVTAGMLTANMNIVCGEAVKTTNDSGLTYFAAGARVTPMIVFFDKNMRMVNCTQVTSSLKVGDNAVSVEVNTAAFANKLSGGFAGLYVWDDMMSIRPLADAAELK